MPVVKLPDGTEVYTDPYVDDEPPAHMRQGRFERRRKPNETERQRVERGLGKMWNAAKKFMLDDDPDDVNVLSKLLDNGDKSNE